MSKQASSGHHFDLNRCLVSKRADSQKRRNHRSAILSLAAVSAVSLGGAGLAQAAESEVLGWNTAGVSVASNSTPLMADTVNSALGGTSANIGLLYGPGFYPNGYFGPGFNGNDNGSGVSSTLAGAEAAGLYFQFTLPASTGQPLNVDAIDVANWFALQRNTPYTFYVTSSLDNYATALGTASVTPTGDLSSLNVPVSSLQGLTAPVTIRIDLSIQAAASNQTFGFSGRGPGQTSDALQVLGTFGAVAVPLTWTGGDGSGGYGTWNSTLSNSWKATTGGAVATYADGDAVTFDSSGVNTSITVDSGGVQPGAITFSNDAAHPYSFNGGPIGGTALTSVTLSGAGSVTLNNSNTYFGGTTVNNGTLSANADGALGTGAVTVTGGKLNANTDGAFPWGSINSGYSGIIPLTVNGGTVNFTSAGPSVSSLAGTGGSVVLSNTNLTLGGDGTSTTYAGTIGQAASTEAAGTE